LQGNLAHLALTEEVVQVVTARAPADHGNRMQELVPSPQVGVEESMTLSAETAVQGLRPAAHERTDCQHRSGGRAGLEGDQA